MEERAQQGRAHKLVITNRVSGNITGVTDVISFDLGEILLETSQGMLSIKGKDLHVSRLTLEKGEVDIDGKIESFTYSDASDRGAQGESFFSRMFK